MTTTTIADFVKAHRIGFKCEYAASNPNMDGSDRMDNWKCVLTCNGRRMTVYFSKGIGHNGAEPTADEVLDCLASDSASVDNANGFEDWASDFGYDPDSRKAEKTYRVCEKQRESLVRLLGDDAYRVLVWETERL